MLNSSYRLNTPEAATPTNSLKRSFIPYQNKFSQFRERKISYFLDFAQIKFCEIKNQRNVPSINFRQQLEKIIDF